MESSSRLTNGHADSVGKSGRTASFGMRARSASLQKGVAVLKALARAPQEGEEDDSGYEDDGGENNVGMVPGKVNGAVITEDREASVESLSEEAKESGRMNREGLRKRNEDKKVEKLLGNSIHSSGSVDSKAITKKKEKKKAKSWEIPRKIFHSSIGEFKDYSS